MSRCACGWRARGHASPGLLGEKPQTGGTRADGTKITAGVPEPMVFDEDLDAHEQQQAPAIPEMGPHVPQS